MDHVGFEVDQQRKTLDVGDMTGSPRHGTRSSRRHRWTFELVEASTKGAGLIRDFAHFVQSMSFAIIVAWAGLSP